MLKKVTKESLAVSPVWRQAEAAKVTRARPGEAKTAKLKAALADPKPAKGTRIRRQAQESIELISRVALDLFLEHGFDNTPLSLIAKTLNLTKAGVYHHFESKEELLYILHRNYIERLMTPLLTKAAALSDPEDRVREFISQYTLMLANNPSAGLLVSEAKRLNPAHLADVQQAWRRTFDLLRDSIAELQKDGRIDKRLNPTYAAFAALGMCTWVSTWYDNTKGGGAQDLADVMEHIFFRGVLSKVVTKKR
jgi:TetR/AcrR family transcriptional regulator, cholesterol catabolism regulator